MSKKCFSLLAFVVIISIGFFSNTQGQAKKSYVLAILSVNAESFSLSEHEKNSIQKKHAANIRALMEQGKLLVVGPFEGGGGIYVFKPDSKESIVEILNEDPAVKANRFNVEVFNWTPRIGNVCSTDTAAEALKYNFVRYEFNIYKATVRKLPELLDQHKEHLKSFESSGVIVIEGYFDNNEGEILLCKKDTDLDALIGRDPTVMNGFMIPEIRSLFVSEGSFCERY
ncbi:YciI family protein [Fulvivirgaceae bacterium BMA10]|uniref:YciI family protein n=1 Tax=Splendidivirga corallicola TaxID=3051826 RepID=A0ABT8KSQ3_9BACT|nr:YciI family protein [Fulvivirgaceae bacterium BMA10]